MYKTTNSLSNESILDQQGIEKVFATCSKDEGLPFDARTETQFDNGLTFEMWVGLWQKVFSENPKRAYKFLVYTGYIGGQMSDVVAPIMKNTRDILGKGNQHRRFVFNCFVIGHS